MNVYPEVVGKGGISATLIKDSISEAGIRLRTYEVTFHRYILAEYNTHRVFSRNAASTRAIPLVRMLQQIADIPAMPIFYGKNQAGMSASEELDEESKIRAEAVIRKMLTVCMDGVAELNQIGLHKQHAGRYLEPWGMVKGVLSFTEGDNWDWLRDDDAAQPEIRELARCMREVSEKSVPDQLRSGDWHLPYIDIMKSGGKRGYSITGHKEIAHVLTLEDAIKVSCARCAAVSYRGEDYGLEKCLQLYERLVGSEKKHSSALEHVGTPIHISSYYAPGDVWEKGVSHKDRDGNLWSGNFKGWVQYRKLVPGENYIAQN